MKHYYYIVNLVSLCKILEFEVHRATNVIVDSSSQKYLMIMN